MNKTTFISLLLLFLLLAPSVYSSAYYTDQKVSLKDDLEGNMYSLGQIILVDKNIQGGFLGAAQEITISSSVSDDIVAAASIINVTGNVGEDLILASAEAYVDSEISGEILIFAGKAVVNNKGVETKDSKILAGDISVYGSYNNLILGANTIFIDADVKGNLTIQSGI